MPQMFSISISISLLININLIAHCEHMIRILYNHHLTKSEIDSRLKSGEIKIEITREELVSKATRGRMVNIDM